MFYVIDSIMGSGKTSGMINYMNDHKDKRWLFITKQVDESDRVGSECNFVTPSKHYTGKKIDNLESLIEEGKSISSTHALFSMMDDNMLSKIKNNNYNLVIDETIQLIDRLDYSYSDVYQLLKYKVVTVDPVSKQATYSNDKYKDGYFNEVKRLSDLGELYALKGELGKYELYRKIRYSFFESFENVYLMTYLYSYQPINKQIEAHNVDVKKLQPCFDGEKYYLTDEFNEPGYDLHVNLVCDGKLNEIGSGRWDLSVSWFKRRGDLEKLKKNIYNVLYNVFDAKASDTIWTCYKDWYGDVKSPRYSKSFCSMNLCATNEYRNRHCVAQCVNRFFPPAVRSFYKDMDVWLGEREFAVSEMIQFVWRSAIRGGECINLYIPSKRMRDLFVEWFNSVSINKIDYREDLIYTINN